MRKVVSILLLAISLNVVAQLPTDFRSEQIYLNIHKTAYFSGDTLQLEGQVTCLAEDRFLPYSNYLYIECFNEKDSVLVRQKVSCKENGYFSTHLPTEYEWAAGVYYLRAYTQLMRNFSSESFAQQPFLLGKEYPKKEEQVYEARCTIVPSGGKLVADHPQTLAVLLTDSARFRMAVDDFKEGEEFYLQAITAKGKTDFAEYLMDEETYPALQNNRRFRLPISRYAETEVIVGNTFDLSYSIDKNNERNYTLPNVTVKARLHTEKVKDTHEFYSTNFVSREELEKRPERNLFDILFDMPGLIVGINIDFSGEEVVTVKSNRGHSILADDQSGDITVPIVIDGVRIKEKNEYKNVLQMGTFEIEPVQYLRPWQALAYTFGAIDGAIIVKTRGYKEREPLPSKGATYSPTGLSPLSYPYKKLASLDLKGSKPGNYRLMVDVITDSSIQSYEHSFEVVE